MRKPFAICAFAIICAACTAPGQVSVNTPQSKSKVYPQTIGTSPERRQALDQAWKNFRTEFQLPDEKVELETVINTPLSLPASYRGRINLNPKGGTLDEIAAKQALRKFIERWLIILSGGAMDGAEGINNLSLTSFSAEPGFYRAIYRQVIDPIRVEGGFGELSLAIGKDGALSQWSSRLIPQVNLPLQAEVPGEAIIARFVGREFTYSSIAGVPMQYKISGPGEVSIKGLVVYPKREGDSINLHLAYRVEAGRGMTWTIFVDAITGNELDVKQNFAT